MYKVEAEEWSQLMSLGTAGGDLTQGKERQGKGAFISDRQFLFRWKYASDPLKSQDSLTQFLSFYHITSRGTNELVEHSTAHTVACFLFCNALSSPPSKEATVSVCLFVRIITQLRLNQPNHGSALWWESVELSWDPFSLALAFTFLPLFIFLFCLSLLSSACPLPPDRILLSFCPF